MSRPDIIPVPPELCSVTNKLDERIEALANGNEDIQNAALLAAKYIFDTSLETEQGSKPSIDNLLSSLNPSQKPQTRSQARADRPVPPVSDAESFELTPISSLFIENMDAEQIWMQLDLRAQTICDLLEFALESDRNEGAVSSEEDEGNEAENNIHKVMEAVENGDGLDLDGWEERFEGDLDMEHGSSEESEDESDEDMIDNEEDVVNLRHSDEESFNSDDNTLFHVIRSSARSRKNKSGIHGLDDDFFDLDSFNAETEQAEAKYSSRGQLADDAEDSEDEDGDEMMDLFAPLDDEKETGGAADIFYRNFFAAPKNTDPPQRPESKTSSGGGGRVRFHDEVRVKKIKAKGDEDDSEQGFEDDSEDGSDVYNAKPSYGNHFMEGGGDVTPMDEDEGSKDGYESTSQEGDDHRATITRLKDDLFAGDDDIDVNDALTTHQRRQVRLQEQIAQLEAENVARKDWTLMGEADNRSRPQNSLLEEDLEFERVMKPIPVVSEDAIQDLEQRIKTRILANQFDDVIRIRTSEDKSFLPSRIIELQDTKSPQSLAQIYERDYLATQGGITDDRDGKLKKEHDEIEQQWEKICNKLDALCNAHFVPKQPKAVISTLSNVATASMESALPTVKAMSSILAPEEVFVPASSELRSRSEFTPTEKRNLRVKARKAKKKQSRTLGKRFDNVAKASRGIGRAKKEQQTALQSIVKSGKGVTVVGKQGRALTLKRERSR